VSFKHFLSRAGFVILLFVALLWPLSAGAQGVLVVTPTSVTASATAGSNPAPQTVRVSNGGKGALKWTVVQSTSGWVSVSPGNGVNSGTLTLSFSTANLAAAGSPYQTTFRVEAKGSTSVTVNVQVTITTAPPPPPPAQLTVSCPTNISVTSPDGNPVVVNYIGQVTTSGGVAPINVTGSPASGTSFAVGSTPVQVTAQSSDNQTATCQFSVSVSYTPPSSTGVGPQTTIACPANAVFIPTGINNIQSAVDAYPAGTTFCLSAGRFSVTTPITPKSGDVFVGQCLTAPCNVYGAILDGTGGTSDNGGRYCGFQAYYPNASSNPNIAYVTIRNLVIRNMHSCAILAFTNSDHWTIDYNEMASNGSGIIFPSDSSIKNNYIHNNSNYGYQADSAHNSVVENNEISFNGNDQKIMQSANVTFRGNFLHHNQGPGIWYDSNNTGALIENNRVEDNGSEGIFYEISGSATIRNNIVRRSGDTGIFISTSRDNQIYNNTLEDNFRGITFLVNCPSVGSGGPGSLFFDLINNSAHDNTIVVGTQSGAFTSALAGVNFPCTNAQLQSYQIPPNQTGSKNNAWVHNSYDVPFLNVQYWYYFDIMKLFSDWQALGQDTTGSVQ
jgi:parallel beta-helix repeat protein